jgi:hypothetical protein
MLHITNFDEDLVANSMNILEPMPLMPLGNPRANSKVSFHFAFNLIPLGLISCCCSVKCTAPVKKLGVPVCYLLPFLFNNFLVELGDSSQVSLSAKCM